MSNQHLCAIAFGMCGPVETLDLTNVDKKDFFNWSMRMLVKGYDVQLVSLDEEKAMNLPNPTGQGLNAAI